MAAARNWCTRANSRGSVTSIAGTDIAIAAVRVPRAARRIDNVRTCTCITSIRCAYESIVAIRIHLAASRNGRTRANPSGYIARIGCASIAIIAIGVATATTQHRCSRTHSRGDVAGVLVQILLSLQSAFCLQQVRLATNVHIPALQVSTVHTFPSLQFASDVHGRIELISF